MEPSHTDWTGDEDTPSASTEPGQGPGVGGLRASTCPQSRSAEGCGRHLPSLAAGPRGMWA